MSAPHADRDHSEQPTHIRAATQLCDDDGIVRSGVLHDGKDYTCTGSAHFDGVQIECTSPIHIERTPSTATAGSDPTQPGTSRAEAARVVRASEAQVVAARECIGEMYLRWSGSVAGRVSFVDFASMTVADAVVAAGPDADEVTRLRAEVERIRDFAERGVAAEARAVRDLEAEVERLQAIVTAAALETYTPDGSERFVAQFWEVLRRAKAAEAKVARVEALADERDALYPPRFGRTPSENYVMGYRVARADLRAALSGPTPAETPQNGPEPALSREQGTSGQSGEGEALRGAEKGAPSIGDTCCGKCPGGTCYVDGVTGA